MTKLTDEDTPKEIYLIDDEWYGAPCKVWSKDPPTGSDMNIADAVKYIREDVVQAQADEIKVLREALDNLENDAGTIPANLWKMVTDARGRK